MSRYDYSSTQQDNCGNRVCGGKKNEVGYVQTTQRAAIIFDAESATKEGLYFDPENPDRTVLNRDDRDFAGEREKDEFQGYDDVKGITSEGVEFYARTQLGAIKVVADCEEAGYWPLESDAEEMLQLIEKCSAVVSLLHILSSVIVVIVLLWEGDK